MIVIGKIVRLHEVEDLIMLLEQINLITRRVVALLLYQYFLILFLLRWI